jgi:hypothetical protein
LASTALVNVFPFTSIKSEHMILQLIAQVAFLFSYASQQGSSTHNDSVLWLSDTKTDTE